MNVSSKKEFLWVRPLAWTATYILILFPLIALKIADHNAWRLNDLPLAFGMIISVGFTFEIALRTPLKWAYRAGAALSIITALLLVLGKTAIGFVVPENNTINVILFAAPAIALIGSIAVNFRASALSIVMACSATTQLSAGLIAYYHGYFTGPLSITFTSLWLASSLLFLRYSRMLSAL